MTDSDPLLEGYEFKRFIPISVIAALRDSPANPHDPEGMTLRELTENQRLLDYFDEDATSEYRELRILEDFERRNPMNPYQEHLNRHSDIREHLGILHGLARNCEQVVELGFRTGVSASAFLAAGASLHSVDIDNHCKKHVQHLAKIYPDTFVFKVGDSRTCEIPECDLLFIDTSHVYETTKIELNKHQAKVGTWIVIHDVTTFGRKDRSPGTGPGIMTAVDEFLEEQGGEWKLWLFLKNNNGLALLRRCCA